MLKYCSPDLILKDLAWPAVTVVVDDYFKGVLLLSMLHLFNSVKPCYCVFLKHLVVPIKS